MAIPIGAEKAALQVQEGAWAAGPPVLPVTEAEYAALVQGGDADENGLYFIFETGGDADSEAVTNVTLEVLTQ